MTCSVRRVLSYMLLVAISFFAFFEAERAVALLQPANQGVGPLKPTESNVVPIADLPFKLDLNSPLLLHTPLADQVTNSIPIDRIRCERLGGGGGTNYCCRVYDINNPIKSSIFIKHAKSKSSSGFGEVELPPRRLYNEFEGINAFARYSPKLVPRTFAYDDREHVMVAEFLAGYKPLSDLFVNGRISIDAAKFIGTMMGRNHARTHHLAVPYLTRQRYAQFFNCKDHLQLWDAQLFEPALEGLHRLIENNNNSSSSTQSSSSTGDNSGHNPMSPMDLLAALETSTSTTLLADATAAEEGQQTSYGGGGVFSRAINQLREVYLHHSDTLIHSDLHANNILYTESSADSSSLEDLQLKVVDFERSYYGPAGLDLGIFVFNYIWYYLAHSNRTTRQTLLNQVLYLFDAYRVAFKTQMSGMLKISRGKAVTVVGSDEEAASLVAQSLASASSSSSSSTAREAAGEAPAAAVDKEATEVAGEVTTAVVAVPSKRVNPDLVFTHDPFDVDIDVVVNEIVVEAMGFAAIYAYFMAFVKPNVCELDLSQVPGYSWGDAAGRADSVKRRLLFLIFDILTCYNNYKESKQHKEARADTDTDSNTRNDNDTAGQQFKSKGGAAQATATTKAESVAAKGGFPFSSEGIRELLQKDDILLATDHKTEFWF